MKLISTLFLATATTLVMTGCGYKAEDETTTALPQNSPQSSLPAAYPATVGDTNIKAQPSTNGNPITATAPVGGNKGINPAHGQPGHRCDIAVGAPLDSKPVSPTTGTTTQGTTATASSPVPTAQPTATVAQPTATGAKTAAGINPPHGQPGHRCDIASGAPLDSKPITTTTTTPTTGSSPIIGSSPLNPASTAPKTGVSPIAVTPIQPAGTKPATGAGLNPAHGQPGHRCDIAVGAPLNSKPTIPAPTAPKQ